MTHASSAPSDPISALELTLPSSLSRTSIYTHHPHLNMSSSATPYPPLYALAFSLLEPAGLLSGAAFALFLPSTFFSAYLGSGWFGDSHTGGRPGDNARLVASGMGSCQFCPSPSYLHSSSELELTLRG